MREKLNPTQIFLPSVALVLLTYTVLLYMFRGRVAGVKKHQVSIQALADPTTEEKVFSDSVNSSDNLENLFEMPVLFYVASLIIFVLSKVDGIYLCLAWLYVAFRFIHSYIHCTSNRVKYRFRVYSLSILVLLVIWIRIAAQILMV